MSLRAVSVAALLAIACASAPTAHPPSALPGPSGRLAHGEGFVVSLPPGFSIEGIKAGGVFLVEQQSAPVDHAFRARIIIGPLRMDHFDAEDPATCASAAAQFVTWTGGTVKKQGIVETRWGRTCHLEVEGSSENPQRRGRATVMRSGAKNWMITCNVDVRDQAAQDACDAVLATILLDPGAHPDPSEAPPMPARTSTERVRGAGYSLLVPSGFAALPSGKPLRDIPDFSPAEALLRAGGVVLVESVGPEVEKPFLGSIVVTPVPLDRFDPADAALCSSVATQMATAAGAGVKQQGIVEMPWGKTCQFAVGGSKEIPQRGGRGTVMRAGTSFWMITCNFDLRDKPAQDACDEVLASFEPLSGARQ